MQHPDAHPLRAFRTLPDHDKWVIYDEIKRERARLEDQGQVFQDSYDEFIRGVTDDLEI